MQLLPGSTIAMPGPAGESSNGRSFLGANFSNSTSVTPSVQDEGIPKEAFALKYAAIQWTYSKQDIKGGNTGNSTASWSLSKNNNTYSV